MSYMNMDHAAWVESNNTAGRRNTRRPKRVEGRTVGYHAAPEKLTPFQARVMNILGSMLGGIYNAGIAWDTVDWDYGARAISVVTSSARFATFDFDHLTKFVLLCHVARIRGCIDAAGPGRWRLSFWQRTGRGGMSSRHPSIDEAVAAFQKELPEDSNIRWTQPMDEAIWDARALSTFESHNKAPFDPEAPGADALLAKVREQVVAGGGYSEIKALFEPVDTTVAA
jgi:hypothetical protein